MHSLSAIKFIPILHANPTICSVISRQHQVHAGPTVHHYCHPSCELLASRVLPASENYAVYKLQAGTLDLELKRILYAVLSKLQIIFMVRKHTWIKMAFSPKWLFYYFPELVHKGCWHMFATFWDQVNVGYTILITCTKEVMFSLVFISLFVSRITQNCWNDFRKIWCKDMEATEETITFYGNLDHITWVLRWGLSWDGDILCKGSCVSQQLYNSNNFEDISDRGWGMSSTECHHGYGN